MNKRTLIQRLSIGFPVIMLMVLLSVCATQADLAAAQIASATPTSSQIQLPTSTATQVGGPTATPSRTPSVAPVTAKVLTEANLRTEPDISTEANIVAKLEGGITLPVVGRWVGYDWLLVAYTEAPGGQAWIHQSVVEITGDLTTVPAVTPLPKATVEPTQAALNATSTVILQTPGAAETATAAAYLAPSGLYTVTPGSVAVAGFLPTFTPPEPYIQPETLAAPSGSAQSRRGPAPAVLIIALGAMGLLTLIVGLLRRL